MKLEMINEKNGARIVDKIIAVFSISVIFDNKLIYYD